MSAARRSGGSGWFRTSSPRPPHAVVDPEPLAAATGLAGSLILTNSTLLAQNVLARTSPRVRSHTFATPSSEHDTRLLHPLATATATSAAC
jgi:hypothetical protein